jgi:CelD/BcsL family acetyltransferase involved in cellulose biosynthesis
MDLDVTGHGRNTVAAGLEGSGMVADLPTVVPIDPVADPRWDELVRRHPDAGPYHLGAWAEILRAAYGDRPAYLGLVSPNGELVGGLPMMRTRGIVTRTRMRSLPVVPPAGPLAPDDEAMRILLAAACRATDAEAARVWTLHARMGGLERLVPELRPLPKHPTWVLDLPDDVDEMRRGWKKTSNNLWRSIRKADRAGVQVREGTSERDLRTFYDLYLRTMRRRGVLPRPFRQLKEDHGLLGPDGAFRLFVAEHEGDIVAGGIYHALGDAVDLLYNGSDDTRLDLRPNHALYWHVIEWAAENGYSELDFGHAKRESSLAKFKAQWSAREVPEYRYDYAPGTTGAARADAARPAAALQGRGGSGPLQRVWPKLPLATTRAAASVAYRWL